MESTFTHIAENRGFGPSKSLSGPGSDDRQTATIKKQIPLLVKQYDFQSFFDVPCGDLYWMKSIVDSLPNYTGADVVLSIINENKKKFNKNFLHFDITKDRIPDDVDLIFCRDLLVHFPLRSIKEALGNIKRSSAKCLLMTTFINREFRDTSVMGAWRPISFFDPPFNFPAPLEMINEGCSESYPRYMDKTLALWRVEDLPD